MQTKLKSKHTDVMYVDLAMIPNLTEIGKHL
jgi:hypothetical protein